MSDGTYWRLKKIGPVAAFRGLGRSSVLKVPASQQSQRPVTATRTTAKAHPSNRAEPTVAARPATKVQPSNRAETATIGRLDARAIYSRRSEAQSGSPDRTAAQTLSAKQTRKPTMADRLNPEAIYARRKAAQTPVKSTED